MDIDQLHNQFVEYGEKARLWRRKCELLLVKIDKYYVWRKKGFSSIYEYTAKLAGMNRDQTYEALRVSRKLEDKPLLRKVAEEKGINRVKPVLSLVEKFGEKFIAEKARTMSKNELELFAKGMRGDGVKKRVVTMVLDADVAKALEQVGGGDWNALMKEFLAMRNNAKPEVRKDSSRHIPADIIRYVRNRAAGSCEFNGCCRKIDELHHADRFASNHTHDPDRIFALCKGHHDLAHEGLIGNEDNDVQYWFIRKYAQRNPLDDKVQFYQRA
ncbi:hypothetical protein JKY72_04580 [Candidatus Gracilibacteria bacterium]|nr:hypothetical protein [Candidatus Gracilibacteria bacterium]